MKLPLCPLVAVSVLALLPTRAAEPASHPSSPALPAAAASPALPPSGALLNLPRLRGGGPTPNDPSRISPARVTVDPLSDQPALGAWGVVRNNVRSLRLAPARLWSRPLRGTPRDATFVSFLAYASVGTIFDLPGARLIVQPGATPGQAQLVADVASASNTALPPTLSVKLESHDGLSLAALPVLTVRLDAPAGTWDLFSFDRLIAADLPLRPAAGPRKFTVLPGATGASLVGLVFSDDHPLFVDANANGIDDAFEAARGSGPAPATPAVTDRRILTAEWMAAQRPNEKPAWRIRRPAPDGTATSRPATPGS